MRISQDTLSIIQALRDCIRDDEGGGGQCAAVTQELTELPEFAGSQTTAGYFVTPSGRIIDDHWWIVMDDGSIFDPTQDQFGEDGFGDIVRISKKDRRHGHYFPYSGTGDVSLEAFQLADKLRARKRVANHQSFREMLGEDVGGRVQSSDAPQDAAPLDMGDDLAYEEPDEQTAKPEDMQLGWNDLLDENDGERFLTPQELQAVETYADRLFAKVGIDVAFSRHFIQRANDPRNRPEISAAELVRLFKQQYRKHGKRIPKLGPDAEAVLRDMATDINVPFVLKLDRDGMLDLVAKTVMRKSNFGTGDEVLAVEVDHPEYMAGGDETHGFNPNYDPAHQERDPTYNRGHPKP